MKITRMTLTDENGTERTYEGVGTTAELLEDSGVVVLILSDDPRVVHRSAVSGEFTTAEDAAAHPETTVTERVDG